MTFFNRTMIIGMICISALTTGADDKQPEKDSQLLPREMLVHFRPKLRGSNLEAGEIYFVNESANDKHGVSRIMRYYELKSGTESVIVISTDSASAIHKQLLGDSNLSKVVKDAAEKLDRLRAVELEAIERSGVISRGSYYAKKKHTDDEEEETER